MSSETSPLDRRALLVAGLGTIATIAGTRLPFAHALERIDVGDTSPMTATPVSTPVVATPEIAIDAIGVRFSPNRITIPANTRIRIVLTNRSAVYHDLVIPALGRRMPRIGPDEVGTLLIRAEPGTYAFNCSIQSHHQAGMEGTITAV